MVLEMQLVCFIVLQEGGVMNQKEYAEVEGHHIREDSRQTEVVYVECEECGLISNDLTDWACLKTDWACLKNDKYDVWYYLCPNCQEEWV
jgi:predicted RNA-binding Zn-ribbon protein involved in translation (DUF1610 family)